MSVSKSFRSALTGAVVAVVLVSGCAGSKAEKNKPGQTGTPIATTTTVETTTTTSVAVDAGSSSSAADSPDGVKLVDGTAPDQRTISIIGGSFQPSTMTVKVGDLVTFKGKGNVAYQLTVGSLEPATVTAGLVETYRFTAPGEIMLSQDQTKDTATITVEGAASTTTTTRKSGGSGGGSTTVSTVAVANQGGASTTKPALTPTSVGPGG